MGPFEKNKIPCFTRFYRVSSVAPSTFLWLCARHCCLSPEPSSQTNCPRGGDPRPPRRRFCVLVSYSAPRFTQTRQRPRRRPFAVSPSCSRAGRFGFLRSPALRECRREGLTRLGRRSFCGARGRPPASLQDAHVCPRISFLPVLRGPAWETCRGPSSRTGDPAGFLNRRGVCCGFVARPSGGCASSVLWSVSVVAFRGLAYFATAASDKRWGFPGVFLSVVRPPDTVGFVSSLPEGPLRHHLSEPSADPRLAAVALLSSVPGPLPADLSRGAGHARRAPAVRLVPSPTGAAGAGTLSRLLLDPQGLRPDVARAAHLVSVYGVTIKTHVCGARVPRRDRHLALRS